MGLCPARINTGATPVFIINDIVKGIGSNVRLFTDDTSVYIIVDDPVAAAELLNLDLDDKCNTNKTESLLISRKINRPFHPPLSMLDQQITEVESHKHLGIYFSNDCTWHKRIEYIKDKTRNRINVMRKLKVCTRLAIPRNNLFNLH